MELPSLTFGNLRPEPEDFTVFMCGKCRLPLGDSSDWDGLVCEDGVFHLKGGGHERLHTSLSVCLFNLFPAGDDVSTFWTLAKICIFIFCVCVFFYCKQTDRVYIL